MPDQQVSMTIQSTDGAGNGMSLSEQQLLRRFVLAGDIRSVADPDGVVVLNIRKGQMLGTNETGREIWQGIRDGLRLRDIVGRICELTGASYDIVSRDTVAFSEQLLALGLVVEIPD
jgi:hypothetical protein